MPEPDFELYLSLLSRFLRLKPAQRGEIADELRDHLEQRLEELAARGLSRGEAIRAALDEFGDAAELANHFTHVAHIRKRRLIMRFTFGTALALAASLVIATAFWPEARNAPAPRIAVAQSGGESLKPDALEGSAAAVEDSDKLAVEAKLSKRIGGVDFQGVSLSDVIEYISEKIDLDILVNGAAIQEAGIVNDGPVTLVIKRANLTARMALDLVLEPLKYSYIIRDGLIMITTASEANQIQVYNVHDLLRSAATNHRTAPAMGGGMMGGMGGGMTGTGGGGFFCVTPAEKEAIKDDHSGILLAQAVSEPGLSGPAGGLGGSAGGMGAGGAGLGGLGGANGGGEGFMLRQTNSLAEVIAVTIDPDSWDTSGGSGSIVQYHEFLIVKNSQIVHGKIKALLDMMRTSARLAPAAPSEPGEETKPDAPGGGQPGGRLGGVPSKR